MAVDYLLCENMAYFLPFIASFPNLLNSNESEP